MKKAIPYVILSILIPFFSDALLDKIAFERENKQLRQENDNQKAQIISRNEVINRHYNEFGQLIEEKERCERTQEIILQEKNEHLEKANKIINEYDQILDSVVSEVIKNENKTDNVPSIVIHQTSIFKSINVPETINTVKTPEIEVKTKKSFFNFIKKF